MWSYVQKSSLNSKVRVSITLGQYKEEVEQDHNRRSEKWQELGFGRVYEQKKEWKNEEKL